MHEIEVFNNEVSTYALRAGDLLVVEGNGSVDQIGRAASWDGSIPECLHQNHLIRVRPGPTLNPEFLALVWNAPTTIDTLKAVASSTSGLHTLSTGKVKSVELCLPDPATQSLLVQEAQRRLSRIDAAEQSVAASIRKTKDLRRSLLVAAFSGKLVAQDPSDEPAELLLKRIAVEREAEASNPKRGRKPRVKSKEFSV
jgi:type I restriction enzyme S subunit